MAVRTTATTPCGHETRGRVGFRSAPGFGRAYAGGQEITGAMSDSPVATTARGLLEITRPVNAILAGVLTFVGAFVGGGPIVSPAVVAAVLATVLAVGAGNSINDYFDREIDRINAPDRPIPSGRVRPRSALAFSGLLFLAAVAFAVTLPLPAIAVAAVNLVALVLYTPWFKTRPAVGNLVVAYLAGSVFLFGGLAVSAPGPALFLALLAGLATFAREVVKDVEDMAGDDAAGLETLPIRVGERASIALVAVTLGAAILASPIPYMFGTFGLPYIVVVGVADALFAYGGYASVRDATTGQTYLKYGMVVAAVAFLVGRLSVEVAGGALPGLG